MHALIIDSRITTILKYFATHKLSTVEDVKRNHTYIRGDYITPLIMKMKKYKLLTEQRNNSARKVYLITKEGTALIQDQY